MQQAFTTSTQFSLPLTSTQILASVNRNILQQRLSYLLGTFQDYLYELNLLNKLENGMNLERLRDKLQQQIKLLENEVKLGLDSSLVMPIESVLQELLNESKLKNQEKLLVHTLIDPLFNESKYSTKASGKLHATFYENRFGFSESHLLKAKFVNNTNSLLKSNKNKIEYQQIRGFRTKDQKKKVDEADLNLFKNLFENIKKDAHQHNSEKMLSSLLNKSTKSTSSLGSIFASNNPTNKSSNLDPDDKIKIAFAEGFLYKQSKEMDGLRKKPLVTILRIFYWACIVFLLIFLIRSFEVSVPAAGNGKNGGGINIRSLTGNVNYEVNPETVTVKFDDVKGLPEAKKELTEIVDFLKDPEKYTKLGARLPKGILLVGPPGCGKTLLAKSVAGEAGVPFFQASGSDFDEMFVGTGSKRVRQLFASARAKAPCVIFIDEIDSVGSKRTNSAIHPHANQTINQLLAEMDGFQKNEGVIVMGATNRRETLDAALMRPGRFDVEVRIDKPDLKARIEILEFYLDKVAKDKDVDVKYLARQLSGLGGSSIENVVNWGALRAVVTNSSSVKMEHLEWALDRTLMGYGKSRLTDEECNRNTAYHEAGHVLVGYFTKDSDSLHKVTILPRALSLGHTAFVPENDVYGYTKSQLLARMDVSMGGRVAEELAFGSDKVTTGASSDFQSATQIATNMVKKFGMIEKIGVRVFDDKDDSDELSPQTKELLDQEIKKLLQESYDRAKTILKTHSYELKLVAEALLVHETLDVDQIKSLIENHKL